MPELPEVETVAAGLRSRIVGQQIDRILIHWPSIVVGGEEKARLLEKSFIRGISRRGKYLFWDIEKNDKNFVLIIHLRMTGQLYTVPRDTSVDKHTHLELFFNNLEDKIVYRDIRKFGRWEIILPEEKEAYIGKRKIADDALLMNQSLFVERIKKSGKNIKTLLLDQTVIAGLGNIYADETLMRAHISPKRIGNSINDDDLGRLFVIIQKTLKDAILKEGTTFSDYVNSYGRKGKFQLELQAYKKDGDSCVYCGSEIVKEKVAGRGTHYCPNCQE